MGKVLAIVNFEINKIVLTTYKVCDDFLCKESSKSIAYDGYNSNGFIKIEDVFTKVAHILEKTPKKVYIVIPSVFTYNSVKTVTTAVFNVVTEKDIEKCREKIQCDKQGFSIFSYQPINYRTNDERDVYNPLGVCCESIKATMNIACLPTAEKELFDNCARKLRKNFTCISDDYLLANYINYRYDVKNFNNIMFFIGEEKSSLCLCQKGAISDKTNYDFGVKMLLDVLSKSLNIPMESTDRLLRTSNINISNSSKENYRVFEMSKEAIMPIKFVNDIIKEFWTDVADKIINFINGFEVNEKLDIYIAVPQHYKCTRGVESLLQNKLKSYVVINEDKNTSEKSIYLEMNKKERGVL